MSKRDELGDLLQTELLGYKLTKQIGTGGMAIVFEGTNTLNPSIKRALKVIRPELASSDDFVFRVTREAQILEELQHRNVVRFYGIRWSPNNEHLVMELELLDGEPLSDVAAEGPSTTEDVLNWLLQAAEGVAAAHELNIVHRDLKPENLILTKKGHVKVLDFGIAKALDDTERANTQTVAGTVHGSPAYMAPEVCKGDVPDTAADVYGLGMCLYELLLGYHPFHAPGTARRTGQQLMFAQIQEDLPELSELREDVSEALVIIASRATAKDPAARYPSALELADAIRGVLGSAGGGPRARDSLSSSASDTRFALPTFGKSSTTKSALVKSANEKPSGKGKRVGIALAAAAILGGAALVYTTTPSESVHDLDASVALLINPEEIKLPLNVWVLIETPRRPVVLGIPWNMREKKKPPPKILQGFRPELRVLSPSVAYEIQRHEVTWEELEPFLQERSELQFSRPPFVPKAADARAKLPATGMPWKVASVYCESLGGSLPSEAQWEYAARGEELRQFPWGSGLLDKSRTNALQVDGTVVAKVESSSQDRTPATADKRAIFDLMGNAREMTVDVWRDCTDGNRPAWIAKLADRDYCPVRGYPLINRPGKLDPTEGASYRGMVCLGGKHCIEKFAKARADVGFRCVRTPKPVNEDNQKKGG